MDTPFIYPAATTLNIFKFLTFSLKSHSSVFSANRRGIDRTARSAFPWLPAPQLPPKNNIEDLEVISLNIWVLGLTHI